MAKYLSELEVLSPSLNGYIIFQPATESVVAYRTSISNILALGTVTSVNSKTGSVTITSDDIQDSTQVNKFVTQTLINKLNGIETGATADLTASEIKALYITQPNAYTDNKDSKLSGIEDNATRDLTSSEIESLYEGINNTNKFTDSEKTKLSNVPSDTNASLSLKADLIGGKVPSYQLPDSNSAYLGGWNASTNTPVISDATGNNGEFYIVDLGGTIDLGSGNTTFITGGKAYHNGSVWEPKDPVDAVSSVAGKTGVVTLNNSDVGLSAVENKSSSTIRSEIVDSDIPITIARLSSVPTQLSQLSTDSDNQRVSSAEKVSIATIANKVDKDNTITNGELLIKKEGGDYEGAGISVNDVFITGSDSAQSPSATLDLSTNSLSTITLSGNLNITAISNAPEISKRRFIHNGYSLTILGKSAWTDDGNGEYHVRIERYGTIGSPIIRIFDAVGGGGGVSAPVGLGTFTGSVIVLDESGFYNSYTVLSNLILSFSTSGHVEGSKKYVKLTFDGTDTFTVQAPQGTLVHTTGFTSGGTPSSGSYILYMTVESGAITVELKSIAVIVATVIIFSDNFDDNSFDTGIYTSDVNANMTLAETGGKLTLKSNGSTGGIRLGAYKTAAIDLSNDLIIAQCDFVQPNSTNILARFGLTSQKINASPDMIVITGSATAAGTLRALSVDGGSTELNSESGVSATAGVSIRVSYIPSTGAFTEEYWNGSWTSLGTGNVDLGANVYLLMTASSTASFSTPASFDNLNISNAAYSTQYPN